MRILRRRPAGTDANEVAMHAAKHSVGSSVTAVVSAVALLFSAFSLWETSLKRADLSVYVAGVVTYSRDNSASLAIMPAGGFEVLAVPVTIANSGARDAAVLGLQLERQKSPDWSERPLRGHVYRGGLLFQYRLQELERRRRSPRS